MKLEEIELEWVEDSNIDDTNIVQESTKIPNLHAKYFKLLNRAALKLKKLQGDLSSLTLAKTEYYNGSMDEFELRERGWAPNSLKILRQDMPVYLAADQDIINLNLKVGYNLQIVKFLEDILKQISNRNFVIKNIIDWSRFTSGGF